MSASSPSSIINATEEAGVVVDAWIENWSPFLNVSMAMVGGLASAAIGIYFANQILAIRIGADKKQTKKISDLIYKGADAFLKAEYKVLAMFVGVVFIALSWGLAWETGICFVCGAFLSALCGWMGMKIATQANVRTTLACGSEYEPLNAGLSVAFRSGAVMSLSVVASGLLGVSLLYLIFDGINPEECWQNISGFAFGASSVALFARVGGGIFTKAADVGADLVGKIEEALEEDDPNNPATIADNVGDNVGDVAGMGADLFESFCGSLIAAATLGQTQYGHPGVALPFWVAGLGSLCSILGCFIVVKTAGSSNNDDFQVGEGDRLLDDANLRAARQSEHILEGLLSNIRVAIYSSSALIIGCAAFCVCCTFGPSSPVAWNLFGVIITGLVCGNLIAYVTEYFTSYTELPTQSIGHKAKTGPATVVIQGLGMGMLSTVPVSLFIVVSVLIAYEFAGVYGVSVAAVGMLSTLGITLATDAYGPVADNAGGIAEMAPDTEVNDNTRKLTDSLDALGNTTAATGKGFAIGSAVLTALALMSAFAEAAGVDNVNLLDEVVLPAMLVGATLPFVFAALTMLSVGMAAESIMYECRDQLNKRWLAEKDGKVGVLDSQRCIAISTQASLKEMVLPGLLAILSPFIIGMVLGVGGLLGLLGGSITTGFLLAVSMSNAGGAWDNAKKWVEKGNLGEGHLKRSNSHFATVVGDTVGDPFKDTSGPALNILIKLMSIVALVMAPLVSPDAWVNWKYGLIAFGILCLVAIIVLRNALAGSTLHDTAAIDVVAAQRKEAIAAEEKSGKKKEAPAAYQQEEEEVQEAPVPTKPPQFSL